MTAGPFDPPYIPGHNNPEVAQVILLIKTLKAKGLTKEEAVEKLMEIKGFSRNAAMALIQLHWDS